MKYLIAMSMLLAGCNTPADWHLWCSNWSDRVVAIKECKAMSNCRVDPIDLERVVRFERRCNSVE